MPERRMLSPEQVSRGTTALAGVVSRNAGLVGGLEFARNVAHVVLCEDAIGECTPVADIINETLRGRRARFPERWEAALTDEGIAEIAAVGGAVWAQAVRAASGRAA